jgi:hypothetical protein
VEVFATFAFAHGLCDCYLFVVAAVLLAGHLVLARPAMDRPRCLIPARFTVFGLVGDTALWPLLGLFTEAAKVLPFVAWLPVPSVCLLPPLGGAVGGFVVGQFTRLWLEPCE